MIYLFNIDINLGASPAQAGEACRQGMRQSDHAVNILSEINNVEIYCVG